MKKIVIFAFMFLILPVLAEEEVYLDLSIPDTPRYNTGKLDFQNQESDYDCDDENYLKPSFQTLKKMLDEDREEFKDEIKRQKK